jgi:hypothetical protein
MSSSEADNDETPTIAGDMQINFGEVEDLKVLYLFRCFRNYAAIMMNDEIHSIISFHYFFFRKSAEGLLGLFIEEFGGVKWYQ